MTATNNKFLLTMLAVIGIFAAVTLENEEIKAKPKEDEVISIIDTHTFNAKGTCKRSLPE